MADTVPGDAHDTLQRFWELQDSGDYARLSGLFAVTAAGSRRAVGVYRVRDGQLTYYRDYMNA